MEYSAESLHYLHIAYVLMFLGQLAYVLWLVTRWNKVKREDNDRNA